MVSAVDEREHRGVTQGSQLRIGRAIAVWVYAGGLHASIPDIAIDIVRQEGRARQHDGSHQHRYAEHQPERPPRR